MLEMLMSVLTILVSVFVILIQERVLYKQREPPMWLRKLARVSPRFYSSARSLATLDKKRASLDIKSQILEILSEIRDKLHEDVQAGPISKTF